MAMTDPLSDLFTRLRNGQQARKEVVESPSSTLKLNVLQVLKDQGYIMDYKVEDLGKGKNIVKITPKYHEGLPVIQELKRVSKPGRRVYAKITDLKPVHNGLGISILSTPKGVMSDYEAREQNVGGEVLCQVF